jgi:hypothetical protein
MPRFSAPLLLLLPLLLPLCAAFPLAGDSAVLVLPQSPSPAQALALRDVQRDLYKVLGFVVPVLAGGAPAAGSLPAGTAVIYLLADGAAPPPALAARAAAACGGGAEAHCVLAAADGGNGFPALFASGGGPRGAVFGWYALSEAVLGVNPLYRFSDDLPAFTTGVVDVADNLTIAFAPPKFAVRAWFVNDEDLLGGHRADPAGETVYDLVMLDAILETLLRLKGNALIPQTNPYPDAGTLALTARRGVIIMSHHYDLLGLNVFAWPLESQDWDWQRNTATMSMAWRASVAAQAALGGEVIWSLGLRGLNDYDYPCGTPVLCGRLISEAIGNQSAWVDELAGPGQRKIVYLWDALYQLLSGGFLTIPADVHIIVTDAGAGFINMNANVSKYGVYGVYTHTGACMPPRALLLLLLLLTLAVCACHPLPATRPAPLAPPSPQPCTTASATSCLKWCPPTASSRNSAPSFTTPTRRTLSLTI